MKRTTKFTAHNFVQVGAFILSKQILLLFNICFANSGVLKGGKDTCGGGKYGDLIKENFDIQMNISDSGGPLQTTIGNQCVFNIIGLTSYGSTFCGGKNSPGIYTRVSSYIDWIEEKVWG